MPQALKIPLAHDETYTLVHIEDAIPDHQYFCPACGTVLILKRGAVKTPHFAHKPSDTCNQETIIHKTAKFLVQQVITDWKAGKAAAPTVKRRCQVCQTWVEQPLPDKVETAVLEYRLPDGFIADVALMVGSTAEAAIEIRVTHVVDEVKTTNLSVPFIELDGYAVLDYPARWYTLADHFNPLTCSPCHLNYQRFQKKTAQIAKQTGIELPTDYYRYAPSRCWKCRKEILVFTWPGQLFHELGQPIREPVPKTIFCGISQTMNDKYWANSCSYCHSFQGGWSLFGKPGSAFCGFDCEEDSADAFRQDLMILANLAADNGYI